MKTQEMLNKLSQQTAQINKLIIEARRLKLKTKKQLESIGRGI